MSYFKFIQCGDHPVNTMGSFALAFLSSSASIPAVLEVTSFMSRLYAGMTSFSITGMKAAPGSIRGDFGLETQSNLVHGSDSPESAAREIKLWFPNL